MSSPSYEGCLGWALGGSLREWGGEKRACLGVFFPQKKGKERVCVFRDTKGSLQHPLPLSICMRMTP